MKSIDEKLYDKQLEASAATIIGQIVFALSRFEFNLGLYLRNTVSREDPGAVDPLITRLSFKSKLDALREVVHHKFSANEICLGEFKQWLSTIDAFRAKRNSFVHGRWTPHYADQQVINTAPGLRNNASRRYSLVELQSELDNANEIIECFYSWCRKWPI
jgi:hypothetical protein